MNNLRSGKKILIVGPAWIGDMVMAQTLFISLKQTQPDCIIDVLAPIWSLPLLERMPEIRQKHALRIGHKELKLTQRYAMARLLREENYDQAILLPNSFKSALIPFLAHIPTKTGWLGEWRFGLLNDIRYLDKKKLPLMIQRFIALGLAKNTELPAELPKPLLHTQETWVKAATQKFQLATSAPILALCPGAEYGAAKRWPATYFAEVALRKLQDGWQVWLFGGPKDESFAHIIQAQTQNQCVNLIGKTNLAEAIDLLSLATAVISNDSGLMHVASALKRPLIAIYGSSSPRFTPPLTDTVKILSLDLPCSPCFKRECPLEHLACLKDLSPSIVLQALDELLS